MQRLDVSDNGRYLVQEDGTPFLWIGDTAWHLADTLDREDVELYLNNRAAKGFNVIQVAAFMGHEADAGQRRNPANAYGHRPFNGDDEPDPYRPYIAPAGRPAARPLARRMQAPPSDYWEHLDTIVRAARVRGLYLALLPCWGRRHVNGRSDRSEDVILDIRSAQAYGAFLGQRYGHEAHLIWVLGGDIGADEPTDKRMVYRRMAEGLVKGATGHDVTWDQRHPAWDRLLMTYHPRGVQSSSTWFHHDAWLDFHMIQTFKYRERVYEMVSADYERRNPIRPVVMGEPAYEGFGGRSKLTSNAYHVRRQAYQSFFAGAAGFTYGCAMSRLGGDGPLFDFGPGWKRLLDLPGAHNVAVELRAFLRARSWWDLVPDQELILEGQGTGQTIKSAVVAADGSEVLVYFPDRTPALLCLDGIVGQRITSTWFDPRDGDTQPAGVPILLGEGAERPPARFLPPHGWLDAVLILQGV
jgi:hypothetical protein